METVQDTNSTRVTKSQKKRRDDGEYPVRTSPIWIDAAFVKDYDDRLRITKEATDAARKVLKKYLLPKSDT